MDRQRGCDFGFPLSVTSTKGQDGEGASDDGVRDVVRCNSHPSSLPFRTCPCFLLCRQIWQTWFSPTCHGGSHPFYPLLFRKWLGCLTRARARDGSAAN